MYKSPTPVHVPGLWITIFSATLTAVLLGGLLLGLGVRAYFHWSVSDTINKRNSERPASFSSGR